MNEIPFNEVDELILDEITEAITKESVGQFAAVPRRVKRLLSVYNGLRRILEGKNVKVTYELHKPYVSMGSITITGKEIGITDPVFFMDALKFADNLDVYPKTDDSMCLEFTFHGLARGIEEGDE